ncbi:hypothetical protein GGE65_007678 [Skermanella aerolata]|uniref:Calx-beta domain-containing protein n=1 Tax=Skermanella aerolata TaxID=393310 RepID=UPI003D19950E
MALPYKMPTPLNAANVVEIDLETNRTFYLANSDTYNGKDLIIYGRKTVIDRRGCFALYGCRSVSIIGGWYEPPNDSWAVNNEGNFAPATFTFTSCREVYMEGVVIDNKNLIVDMSNLKENGGDAIFCAGITVPTNFTMQNCHIMNVRGVETLPTSVPADYRAKAHGDFYQSASNTMGSTGDLRFYNCTMSGNYQGVFLDPQKSVRADRPDGTIRSVTLNRVNLKRTQNVSPTTRLFFMFSSPDNYESRGYPVSMTDFYVNPNAPGATNQTITDAIWPSTSTGQDGRFSNEKYRASIVTDTDTGRRYAHWPRLTNAGKVCSGRAWEGRSTDADFCPANLVGLNYVQGTDLTGATPTEPTTLASGTVTGTTTVTFTATSAKTNLVIGRTPTGAATVSAAVALTSPQPTWLSGGPGTVAIASDTSVTLTGTGTPTTYARRIFETVPGQSYTISFTANSTTGTWAIGTSSGGGELFAAGPSFTATNSTTFTATTGITHFQVQRTSVGSVTVAGIQLTTDSSAVWTKQGNVTIDQSGNVLLAADGSSPTYARRSFSTVSGTQYTLSMAATLEAGTLIEPERTQLVWKSRAPQYIPVQATSVLDGSVQTPVGLGALKLTPNSTVAFHGFNFYFESGRSGTIPDGSTVAIHLIFKLVGLYQRASFSALTKAGLFQTVVVNATGSGSIVPTPTVKSASISPETDGFLSLRVVVDYASGTTTPAFNMSFSLDDGTRSFAADNASHMLIAYFGAEIGSEVTSPILTDGTLTVPRYADLLTSQPSWMRPVGKSLGIKYTPLGNGSQTILQALGSDMLELRMASPTLSYNALTANVLQATINGTGKAPGTPRTNVITAGPNDFRLLEDGRVVGRDQQGLPPQNFTSVRIGAQVAGSGGGPLALHHVKYWPTALGDTASVIFSRDLASTGVVKVLPIIDIQPTRTVEPNENTVTLIVSLDGEQTGVRVNYATVDVSAGAGVDYVPASGTLIIDPGQGSASVTVGLAPRGTEEDRVFRLILSAPVDGVLGNSTCEITLRRVIPQGPSATTQSFFDGTVPPAGWTLTRTTSARTRNSNGIWTPVAADGYRRHFVSPGISGLLLEPAAAEQRLFDSVDPGWGTTGSTKAISTATQTAVGTRSLVWRETATTGEHKLTLTVSTNGDMPTTEFTTSFMIRPVGRAGIRLRIKGIDNVWKQARFAFVEEAVLETVEQDTGIVCYCENDPFFAGWYQIGMNRPQSVTAGVLAEIELYSEDDAGTISFAGSTTAGFDLAHVQLEAGAGISSPIVVQGATAKTLRDRDIMKAAAADTWYKTAAYSLGVRFIRLRGQPSVQRIVMLKDQAVAVAPDDIGMVTGPNQLRARVKVQNTQLADINSPTFTTPGVSTTALLVVESSRVAMFHDGIKIGQDALTVASVVPQVLRIGATEPSGNEPNMMLIQQVYHWNYALGDTDAALFSGNLAYSPVAGPAPLPIVSVPANLTVAEGATISIPITKSGAGACSVSFTTRFATAINGTDYTGIGPVTVSFLDHETVQTLNVVTLPDTVSDSGKQFTFTISAPVDCELGPATGTVTIYEPPVVSIQGATSVTEGGAAQITVTKASIGACSVTYRTQAVTATVEADYTRTDPTLLTFGENEASKTISIQTATDATPESNETFNVLLENPIGCRLGATTSCTVTIVDPSAEAPPEVGIYPTAVGFASAADCGLGYPVYRVTTLADSGTGSLRAGCSVGNALIVFEVGGAIKLTSDLPIASNCTIAGETAPAPGITIQQKEFGIRSSNVRVSHVTFEKGYDATNLGNSDCGKVAPGSGTTPTTGRIVTNNVHFYHCAFYWSMDEMIEHWPWNSRTLTNVSYHDCIFAEPLWKPSAYDSTLKNHDKVQSGEQTQHNYGVILGFGTKRVDMQYCLFADMDMREPFIDHTTEVVLANMIVNNATKGATIQHNRDPVAQKFLVTCKGYLAISGPNSTASDYAGFRWHSYVLPLPAGSAAYVRNLYGWRGTGASMTPLTEIRYGSSSPGFGGVQGKPYYLNGTTQVAVEVDTPPIDTPTPTVALSAQEIYDRALANIGPRPKERADTSLPANTSIRRTVQRLRDKTGKWPNHQNEVGGFYSPATTTRKLDGTTTFLDGSTIAAPPAQPQPATATSKANMKTWLRKFLDQVQYD